MAASTEITIFMWVVGIMLALILFVSGLIYDELKTNNNWLQTHQNHLQTNNNHLQTIVNRLDVLIDWARR